MVSPPASPSPQDQSSAQRLGHLVRTRGDAVPSPLKSPQGTLLSENEGSGLAMAPGRCKVWLALLFCAHLHCSLSSLASDLQATSASSGDFAFLVPSLGGSAFAHFLLFVCETFPDPSVKNSDSRTPDSASPCPASLFPQHSSHHLTPPHTHTYTHTHIHIHICTHAHT